MSKKITKGPTFLCTYACTEMEIDVVELHRFRKSMKDVETLPGFQTRKRWVLEKLHAQRQKVQDALQEKLGAIECESCNVEVQWNNIKKCVLDAMSDLVGKVKKRARKQWIAREMIGKVDERRKWKNVNNEEGRKKSRENSKKLRSELKRAIEKAKMGYLLSICDEIVQFQRRGCYDLMYMKKRK